MADDKNFIGEFQKQHTQLLNFIDSFREAVSVSNHRKAKKIISEIDDIAERHFNFEETYLYPRIRRLVREMTEKLQNEQKILRDFVIESKGALKNSRFNKDKLSIVLDMLPDVSRFVNECNDVAFIARKFTKEDEEDLSRRFKECRERRVKR